MVNKEEIDNVTSFLESCWDENQETEDNLTFDERVTKRMKELPEAERRIVEKALSWG